jgi:hypothetical protein
LLTKNIPPASILSDQSITSEEQNQKKDNSNNSQIETKVREIAKKIGISEERIVQLALNDNDEFILFI